MRPTECRLVLHSFNNKIIYYYSIIMRPHPLLAAHRRRMYVCVCVFVCLRVVHNSELYKMAQAIQMPFGAQTHLVYLKITAKGQ